MGFQAGEVHAGMLRGPKGFISHCPLVTDIPIPLPCPCFVEKSETSNPGLLAQAPSAAKRCTSPAACLQPGFHISLGFWGWFFFFFLQPNPREIKNGKRQFGKGSVQKAGRKHRTCAEMGVNALTLPSRIRGVGSQPRGCWLYFIYM